MRSVRDSDGILLRRNPVPLPELGARQVSRRGGLQQRGRYRGWNDIPPHAGRALVSLEQGERRAAGRARGRLVPTTGTRLEVVGMGSSVPRARGSRLNERTRRRMVRRRVF